MDKRNSHVVWYQTRLMFGLSVFGLLSSIAGAQNSYSRTDSGPRKVNGSADSSTGSKQSPFDALPMAYTVDCAPVWLPTFDGGGGPDGTVQCVAVFDSGNGPELYAAGQFKGAAGVPVVNIAKYDGTSWSPLANGLNGGVISLQVFDDGGGDALYAAGSFTASGSQLLSHIAKWDGVSWSALGNGLNGAVRSLAVYDDGGGDELYAGGPFSSAGNTLVNSIAKWDGAQWEGLDTGLNIFPNALEVFDDGSGAELYAAGSFTSAGGIPSNHIARWNGAYWSSAGAGVAGSSSTIHALSTFDDGSGLALFVGGAFSSAAGVPVENLAKWDGTNWAAVPGGATNNVVSALHSHDDGNGHGASLFVGGTFTQVGGMPAIKVAEWNGSVWSALGAGLPGGNVVHDFASFDQGGGAALFVGGDFDEPSGSQKRFLARWGCYGTDNDYSTYCFGDESASGCPCGNSGMPGEGCLNSSGAGAYLLADGSASAAADDFRLSARQLTPGRSAMLFSGSTTVNGGIGSFFGDGLLCVAGKIKALGVRVSSSAGESRWGPGLLQANGWVAGEFRTFQVIYRDHNGWPCGTTFNLSNGVRVGFQP